MLAVCVCAGRMHSHTVWKLPPDKCPATALEIEGFSATHNIFVMLDLAEFLKDLVPEAFEPAECCLLLLGSHKCHEAIPTEQDA